MSRISVIPYCKLFLFILICIIFSPKLSLFYRYLKRFLLLGHQICCASSFTICNSLKITAFNKLNRISCNQIRAAVRTFIKQYSTIFYKFYKFQKREISKIYIFSLLNFGVMICFPCVIFQNLMMKQNTLVQSVAKYRSGCHRR